MAFCDWFIGHESPPLPLTLSIQTLPTLIILLTFKNLMTMILINPNHNRGKGLPKAAGTTTSGSRGWAGLIAPQRPISITLIEAYGEG